jgi:hypothetical protein
VDRRMFKSKVSASHARVAGRATFAAHTPRLYAYVHKKVPSAAARLDHFLHQCGVGPPRNASPSSATTPASSTKPSGTASWPEAASPTGSPHRHEVRGRAANSVGLQDRRPHGQAVGARRDPRRQVAGMAHGKGSKAVARLKALDDRLMFDPVYECTTLRWNLQGISGYIRNNDRTLVNYGARHRKGLAISSSVAESAINQAVSLRMAKKQQMRWTDAGAQYLVQVRVADLNGEFSAKRLAKLAKPTSLACPMNASRHDCLPHGLVHSLLPHVHALGFVLGDLAVLRVRVNTGKRT